MTETAKKKTTSRKKTAKKKTVKKKTTKKKPAAKKTTKKTTGKKAPARKKVQKKRARRTFTDEQKHAILDEADAAKARGESVQDVLDRHNVRPTLVYLWRKALGRSTVRKGADVSKPPLREYKRRAKTGAVPVAPALESTDTHALIQDLYKLCDENKRLREALAEIRERLQEASETVETAA